MSNSLFQNSFYIGNTFNGILYGVELVLYVQTMRALSRQGNKRPRTKRVFMFFNTALLFLITMFVAVQAVFGQEMWIINADFEGGSAAYLATHTSVWYETLGTTAVIALQLMSDAFLIYRCFTICNSFFVLIFPCILWVATLVFGILQLYYSGLPSGNVFVGLAATVGVTYVSVSIGLNVIVSCIMCARISYLGMAGYSARHTARQKETLKYAGTIPIVVESALLYAIAGIAFAVSYGIGSQTSILFMSIYAMSTCISPQLIIMRIADGTAWERYEIPQSPAVGLRETTSGMTLRSSAKAKTESQYSTTDADWVPHDWRSSSSRYNFPVVVDKTVSVDVAVI